MNKTKDSIWRSILVTLIVAILLISIILAVTAIASLLIHHGLTVAGVNIPFESLMFILAPFTVALISLQRTENR